MAKKVRLVRKRTPARRTRTTIRRATATRKIVRRRRTR